MRGRDLVMWSEDQWEALKKITWKGDIRQTNRQTHKPTNKHTSQLLDPEGRVGEKQVLRGTFGEIWRIQIQIYPQTSIEPRYGAFSLTNKVSAHRLGLLVQLSWRVAPPFPILYFGPNILIITKKLHISWKSMESG